VQRIPANLRCFSRASLIKKAHFYAHQAFVFSTRLSARMTPMRANVGPRTVTSEADDGYNESKAATLLPNDMKCGLFGLQAGD